MDREISEGAFGFPGDPALRLERARQQRPTKQHAAPRSLIVRFPNYRDKQLVLSKAWPMRNLHYYMDNDYSPGKQRKRREYADIKKELREKNIRFQTPYPAKLRVRLKDGAKTYNSAWEAVEDLQPPGIKASISEDERLERANQDGPGGQRRGGMMNSSLFQDVETLQRDVNTGD